MAIYGVVIHSETQNVDRAATEKLRAKFPGAAR
jgi:hypothetical protein